MKWLFLLIFLVSPLTTFGAWIATDDLESYTPSASLDNGSGGTNWSGNWDTTGTTIVTGVSGMTGNSAFNNGNETEASRPFTAVSGTNEVEFYVRPTSTSVPIRPTFVETGVASRFYVRFGSDGNIYAVGSGSNLLQAYTANTTYLVRVKFGHNGNNFAVSINDGEYSSDYATNGNPLTVNLLGFTNEGNTGHYFDDIRPYESPEPPASTTATSTLDQSTATIFGFAWILFFIGFLFTAELV